MENNGVMSNDNSETFKTENIPYKVLSTAWNSLNYFVVF